MSKRFKGIKTELQNLEYNFNAPSKDGVIDINYKDSIEILEIREDAVDFLVIRVLNFKSLENSSLKVAFKASIKTSEKLTKEEFKKCFDEEIPMINAVVFNRISLLIANVTNASSIGPIITPPTFIPKEIEIK